MAMYDFGGGGGQDDPWQGLNYDWQKRIYDTYQNKLGYGPSASDISDLMTASNSGGLDFAWGNIESSLDSRRKNEDYWRNPANGDFSWMNLPSAAGSLAAPKDPFAAAPQTTDWSSFNRYNPIPQLGQDVLRNLDIGGIGQLNGGGRYVQPGADVSGTQHDFFEVARRNDGNLDVYGPNSQIRGGAETGPINMYDPSGKYLSSHIGTPWSGHWKAGLWAPVTLATAGMTGMFAPGGAMGEAAGAGAGAASGAGFGEVGGGLMSGSVPAGSGFGLSASTPGLAAGSTYGGSAIGGGLAQSLAGGAAGSAAGAGYSPVSNGSNMFDPTGWNAPIEPGTGYNLSANTPGLTPVSTYGGEQIGSGVVGSAVSGGGGGTSSILDKAKEIMNNPLYRVGSTLAQALGRGGGGGQQTSGPSLADIVGAVGGGVDASRQGDAANKLLDWLNTNQKKMEGYYDPNSAEYQQLWEAMSRKDAAAGRNSQYGPRTAQFAAEVAKDRANNIRQFTSGTARAYSDALNQDAAKYSGLSAALQRAVGDGRGLNLQSLADMLGFGSQPAPASVASGINPLTDWFNAGMPSESEPTDQDLWGWITNGDLGQFF